MTDPNTGQTPIDGLGLAMLEQQLKNQPQGMGGILSSLMSAYMLSKIQGKKPDSGYQGPMGAPSLVNNLPNIWSS